MPIVLVSFPVSFPFTSQLAILQKSRMSILFLWAGLVYKMNEKKCNISYIKLVATKSHNSSVSMTARSPPSDWQRALPPDHDVTESVMGIQKQLYAKHFRFLSEIVQLNDNVVMGCWAVDLQKSALLKCGQNITELRC